MKKSKQVKIVNQCIANFTEILSKADKYPSKLIYKDVALDAVLEIDEEDVEDLYILHPVTNERCETIDDCLVDLPEDAPMDQWNELVRFISEDVDLGQKIYEMGEIEEDEPREIVYMDEEEVESAKKRPVRNKRKKKVKEENTEEQEEVDADSFITPDGQTFEVVVVPTNESTPINVPPMEPACPHCNNPMDPTFAYCPHCGSEQLADCGMSHGEVEANSLEEEYDNLYYKGTKELPLVPNKITKLNEKPNKSDSELKELIDFYSIVLDYFKNNTDYSMHILNRLSFMIDHPEYNESEELNKKIEFIVDPYYNGIETQDEINELNDVLKKVGLKYIVPPGDRLYEGDSIEKIEASEEEVEAKKLTRKDIETNLSDENYDNDFFYSVDLSGADLSGLNLSEMEFRFSNLSKTNFSNTNLREAFFHKCNLTEANFSNADLSYAEFKDCTTTDINLDNADLNGTVLNAYTKGIEASTKEVNSTGDFDKDLWKQEMYAEETTKERMKELILYRLDNDSALSDRMRKALETNLEELGGSVVKAVTEEDIKVTIKNIGDGKAEMDIDESDDNPYKGSDGDSLMGMLDLDLGIDIEEYTTDLTSDIIEKIHNLPVGGEVSFHLKRYNEDGDMFVYPQAQGLTALTDFIGMELGEMGAIDDGDLSWEILNDLKSELEPIILKDFIENQGYDLGEYEASAKVKASKKRKVRTNSKKKSKVKASSVSAIEKKLQKKYPNAHISFLDKSNKEDKVLDINFLVPDSESERFQGGSWGELSHMLDDLVRWAHSNNYILITTPDFLPKHKDSFKKGGKKKLEKLYKEHKFLPNKGKNKDFRFRETMIKVPKEQVYASAISKEELELTIAIAKGTYTNKVAITTFMGKEVSANLKEQRTARRQALKARKTFEANIVADINKYYKQLPEEFKQLGMESFLQNLKKHLK